MAILKDSKTLEKSGNVYGYLLNMQNWMDFKKMFYGLEKTIASISPSSKGTDIS